MGGPTRMFHAALGLALVASLMAFAAPAAATKAPILPSTTVATYATTGDSSELLRGIPISKRQGKLDRVAMSIAPDQFDPIQVGDRLRVDGEVQVSTTCVEAGPRCFGTHYDLNPKTTARLVLSSEPSSSAGFI